MTHFHSASRSFLVIAIFLLFLLLPLSSFAADIAPLTPKERKAYEALSPFEFKDLLIDTAKKSCERATASGKTCTLLNAGRGNPNFYNTTVRDAFNLLSMFAVKASKTKDTPDLGYRPSRKGIAAALTGYLNDKKDVLAALFLARAIDYASDEMKINKDDLVFELTTAALGDYYPEPPRMLISVEKIVRSYLYLIHFRAGRPAGSHDLFATEGATAAMIYIFNSLQQNSLLKKGDHIAIVTPIFSPYLEIPVLSDYKLRRVYMEGSEKIGWRLSDKEIRKLKDKKIKALFMVNPMNPASVGLDVESMKKIVRIVRTSRKDLIVVSDTVYAPFVDEFHDLSELLPENTLTVYSYSKYFGVTGWRLGVVMLSENNAIDRMIAKLPAKVKTSLNSRYGLDSTEPEKIKFIDRMEMDSRAVALAHTGGLSTPQQLIMALFSLYELMDKDHAYKKSIQNILDLRIKALYSKLPVAAPEGKDNSKYYTLIDIMQVAEKRYGRKFAEYLEAKYSPFDFLLYLSREKRITLLPGIGFAGPKWSVRVSLANLDEEDYRAISAGIAGALQEFYSASGVITK